MKTFFFKLSLITTILSISVPAGKAVQFPDGRVSFDKSPRLLNVTTTFSEVRAWGAKYYFTIALPDDLGEPLQKLIITQREAQEYIPFKVAQTLAFVGTKNDKGTSLSIQSVAQDETTASTTIIFEPPLSPGMVFTVGVKPVRNPDYDGIYLFGVTAFPAGEESEGLYLGVGRLHFYRGGDSFGID